MCIGANPNNIGCHTQGKSDLFSGTQNIERSFSDMRRRYLKMEAKIRWIYASGTEANIQRYGFIKIILCRIFNASWKKLQFCVVKIPLFYG